MPIHDMPIHDEDTAQYVAALRTSSDRARFALYVTVVATVLVFIATHNISEDGWPRQRLDAWYKYGRETPPAPPPPREIARGDAERLRELRAEYVKQFTARALLTTSPIPGVSIDVNDLGLFGGITLTLLMLVLAASIAREHENVYLSMYKVRLVVEADPEEQSRGGSRANLLYHALAMTQVLNSPPTLARWRSPRILPAFRIIYLAPALVYGWVVWTEWNTRDVSRAYGVDVLPMVWFEAVLLAVLLLLGTLTWRHSLAMAHRWERAFFVVNPGRRAAPQMSDWEWLRFGSGKGSESHLRDQRLRSELIDRLEARSAAASAEVRAEVEYDCKSDRVSLRDLRQVCEKLVCQGKKKAENQCTVQRRKFVALDRFSTAQDVLQKQHWTVSGNWKYRYTDLPPENRSS